MSDGITTHEISKGKTVLHKWNNKRFQYINVTDLEIYMYMGWNTTANIPI